MYYEDRVSTIHGIWFYNKDLCLNVTRSLEQLVYKLSVRAQKGPKQRTKSLGDSTRPLAQKKQEGETKGSIDIMQMLSKAQHEYNQTKTVSTKDVGKPIPQSEPQVIRPIPVKVDGQNASGDGSLTVVQVKGQQHEITQPRTGPPKFKRSVSVQERSKEDDVKSGEVLPLLQRLFSQSDASQVQVASTSGDMMKTVESLERLHVADIEGGDSSRTDPSGSESGKKPIDSLLQMLSYNEEQTKRSPLTPEALQKPTGFSNVAAGTTGHTVEPQLISHEAPHRIASKGLNPLVMKPVKTMSQQAVSLPGLSRGTASSNSMAISPDFGAGGDAGTSLTMLGQASPTEGAVVVRNIFYPKLCCLCLLNWSQCSSFVSESLFEFVRG
ncbi:putative mRNA-decapping enzyme 1B [Apostichopus japonicus]|uniref:Putative mRNA-decapping enzyme 1B n=1 Tax=Stichopus japonicus TaxID=307972 RepID=A0A2G8K4W1_STIJA|nr:putative mRNA-decapping enzyme 1B [Apostichopus japonicus]